MRLLIHAGYIIFRAPSGFYIRRDDAVKQCFITIDQAKRWADQHTKV